MTAPSILPVRLICVLTREDASAREFASIVHAHIAGGCALGDAVHAARRALYDQQRADWGNFLLYGDHAMIL